MNWADRIVAIVEKKQAKRKLRSVKKRKVSSKVKKPKGNLTRNPFVDDEAIETHLIERDPEPEAGFTEFSMNRV